MRASIVLVLFAAACGGAPAGSQGTSTTSEGSGTGSSSSSGGAASASLSSQTSSSANVSSQAAMGSSSAPSASASGGTLDPAVAGPHPAARLQAAFPVASTSTEIDIDCAYPTDVSGPTPVVVVSHGFQLPPGQYRGYVERLASHGFIAMTVAYNAPVFSVNHVKNAREVLGALDWAASRTEFSADMERVGLMGHSLGGKLSFLAASLDTRVDAVLGLDPVDGAMGCSEQNCPDVSDLMPSLAIPTGFLGELTDATGGFQPCAPANNNYQTFYAGAQSPSFAVTVVGANHMSFLDDVGSCGFVCSFCNDATADNDDVHGLARAYAAAFFRRHLRDELEMQAYLTGAVAQERYVQTGKAAIESK